MDPKITLDGLNTIWSGLGVAQTNLNQGGDQGDLATLQAIGNQIKPLIDKYTTLAN